MNGSTKRFLFFRTYLFILFLHTCMFPAWCFRLRTCMAQSLVNEVFNDTWIHSFLLFEWFSLGYGIFMKLGPFFFLECVSLINFTPHLLLCVCEEKLKKQNTPRFDEFIMIYNSILSSFIKKNILSLFISSSVISFRNPQNFKHHSD